MRVHGIIVHDDRPRYWKRPRSLYLAADMTYPDPDPECMTFTWDGDGVVRMSSGFTPITARKCGYCFVGPTVPAGPLFPALGTGESYHAGCVDRAEARLAAGLPPITALDPAGDDIPDGIGFDGPAGDLYGPGE